VKTHANTHPSRKNRKEHAKFNSYTSICLFRVKRVKLYSHPPYLQSLPSWTNPPGNLLPLRNSAWVAPIYNFRLIWGRCQHWMPHGGTVSNLVTDSIFFASLGHRCRPVPRGAAQYFGICWSIPTIS
jgi:hypothetical protein